MVSEEVSEVEAAPETVQEAVKEEAEQPVWDPSKVIRQEDPDAPKERKGNFSGGKIS